MIHIHVKDTVCCFQYLRSSHEKEEFALVSVSPNQKAELEKLDFALQIAFRLTMRRRTSFNEQAFSEHGLCTEGCRLTQLLPSRGEKSCGNDKHINL